MSEDEISRHIVDAAIQIHRKLGPGLLESVYEKVLAFDLRRRGLQVQQQQAIAIEYDSLRFDAGFRADLMVSDKVIVELKSIESLHAIHAKKLLTYLRLSDRRLGLLLNFGEVLLKNGIHRIVNGLQS